MTDKKNRRWTDGVAVFDLASQFNQDIIGLPIPAQPQMLQGNRLDYSLDHLTEEVTELRDAETVEDQVDALVDLMYVAAGRLIEMGVDPGAHFLEVHAANMRRVRGQKSTRPNSLGFDAVKPEGWVGPDHSAVIRGEVFHLDPMDDGSDWNPKVLVLGYARHGKDTVCEMLRDRYGLRFTSSSEFCAEHVMLPYFKGLEALDGPIYADAKECFEERHNHRNRWFDQIAAFNHPDLSRLGRAIYKDHDVYCGLRNHREFHAVKAAGLYDVAIWVDASARGIPPEGALSCTVEPWMADFVLDNGGSLEDLQRGLDVLMFEQLGVKPLEGR